MDRKPPNAITTFLKVTHCHVLIVFNPSRFEGVAAALFCINQVCATVFHGNHVGGLSYSALSKQMHPVPMCAKFRGNLSLQLISNQSVTQPRQVIHLRKRRNRQDR
nr:MAG TPA: hypothetical protein [Caudoviricetes sp.]